MKPTEDDLARDLVADLAWIVSDEVCIHPRAVEVAVAGLRRALVAEAILDAPLVALFADGREPSENERCLLNLLSWRERKAVQAKAEVVRLQALVAALADRVAGQSEALARRAEGTA